MSDVIIIGNGPAGISTALYTARAGLKTTIIGKDSGALSKADKIENYYGFESPISGQLLVSNGISQAKSVGANILSEEVVGINYNGKLVVQTKNNEYTAESVIIATGSSRTVPKIKGLTEFEGRGISYCAVCDAFFYKGKDVAVLGSGEYALHEALELLPTSNSVTLLTNGKPLEVQVPQEIKVNEKEIELLQGDNTLNNVVFKDGTTLDLSGIFVAIGVAGSTDLARKIGAETNGAKIVVDSNMATTIPGLYAAGDCTGGMLQISKAVYEGSKAGTEVVKYVRKNRKNDLEVA